MGVRASGADKGDFVVGQLFMKKFPVYFNYDLYSVSFLKPVSKTQEDLSNII